MDTFAQDFCLGSANLLFLAGRKCYANKFTLFGDFEYHAKHLDVSPLLARLQANMHICRLGDFKARFNQFEDLQDREKSM